MNRKFTEEELSQRNKVKSIASQISQMTPEEHVSFDLDLKSRALGGYTWDKELDTRTLYRGAKVKELSNAFCTIWATTKEANYFDPKVSTYIAENLVTSLSRLFNKGRYNPVGIRYDIKAEELDEVIAGLERMRTSLKVRKNVL